MKTTCKICGREFSGNRSGNALSKHLKSHNYGKNKKYSYQDYYDKYILKTKDEKICKHENCNNTTKFWNIVKGYLPYCCSKCGHNSQIKQEKRRITCLEKYGVDHNFKIVNENGFRPCEETWLKKYGVTSPSKNEKIKEKAKQTNLKKYGVPWTSMDKNIREKQKQTCLQNFGVEYSLQSDEVKKQIKQTLLTKYGVDNYRKSEECKQKIKKTKLERYDNENYNNSIQAKKTFLKRYGKYSNFFPNFSWSSQCLFDEIINKFNNNLKCFYATNGKQNSSNEYQVFIEDKNILYFLDFYIPKLNKWIEFDEEYHEKPCQIKKDKFRTKQIKRTFKDIDLLRISENEFLNNTQETIDKCINFILG